MRTLNLYVGKSLVLTTLMAVGVLTFVMLTANLFRTFELLSRGIPPGVLLRFVVLLLPDMLTFTMPFGVLCASVLVFSRFAADNEVTAMRAGGISLWQIISPGLVLAAALSGLCLWLHTTISPRCRYRADQLRMSEGVRNPLALVEPGRFVEFPGYVMKAGGREGNRLTNLHIFAFQEDGKLRDITARRGEVTVDEESRLIELSLEDASIAEIDLTSASENKPPRRVASSDLSFPINYGDELDRRRLTRKLKYMDFPMIFARIYIDSRVGRDTTPHYVELNTRMSMGLSPFAFLLMGIPFGIRTRRSETLSGLLVSLLLACGFYAFVLLADGMKHQAAYHPEVLVWLPNIAYQAGGLWVLAGIAKK